MVLTRKGIGQPCRRQNALYLELGGNHTDVSICKNSLSCALQMYTFYGLCDTSIEKEKRGKHFLKGKGGKKKDMIKSLLGWRLSSKVIM